MNIEKLTKQFKDLGLTLKRAKEPFARGADADKIFGLDIRREFAGNARSEYFLCWPGHEDTIVNVAASDKEFAQLVLTVKEAEVEFETLVQPFTYRNYLKHGEKWLSRWLDEAAPAVPKKGTTTTRRAKFEDFNFVNGELWLKTRTQATVRHFLVGRDERQLFMTQLSKAVTSIKAAHDSLKSPLVTLAEGKNIAARRQGEWFFLECDNEQRKEIEDYLAKSTCFIHKKVSIGQHAGRPVGKPHTVDELIKLPPPKLEHGWSVRPRDEIFVRGSVRHADHKTIKLDAWRRVVLNSETLAASGGARIGGTWID